MTQKNVFISHSSKDLRFVDQIIKDIKDLGVAYWKAPEMIPAGSNYAKEIPKAIRECDVFLLVVSKTSQESIWVEKEIDSAINCRKTILPVVIDAAPICDMFKFYLNNVQMVPFGSQKEKLAQVLWPEKYGLKKDVNDEEDNKRTIVKRQNVLAFNNAPICCRKCSGAVKEVQRGVYVCEECGTENYDDFQKVKRYLEKNGAAPAIIIERDTGVPRKAIDYFFRNESLEIPRFDPYRALCSRCGAPIRTGVLCDNCKRITGNK